MPFVSHILELFDPRGRLDRKGLLVVAFSMLSLQVAAGTFAVRTGIALDHPAIILAKVLFLWLATAAVSKRLHDLDRSAWVVPKAAGLLLMWSVLVSAVLMLWLGRAALQQGETGFWLSVAATTLPVFVATLWLHCAPGSPGTNRYGPLPGTVRSGDRPSGSISGISGIETGHPVAMAS